MLLPFFEWCETVWIGRAVVISDMPSSSCAWAASSCAEHPTAALYVYENRGTATAPVFHATGRLPGIWLIKSTHSW